MDIFGILDPDLDSHENLCGSGTLNSGPGSETLDLGSTRIRVLESRIRIRNNVILLERKTKNMKICRK